MVYKSKVYCGVGCGGFWNRFFREKYRDIGKGFFFVFYLVCWDENIMVGVVVVILLKVERKVFLLILFFWGR